MSIFDYDINFRPQPQSDDIDDGWEEITVSDFLQRENATDDEIKRFSNTYFAINIHQMISVETVHNAIETITDYHTDPRLKGMNAIVFLSLKRKGRGVSHRQLSQDSFNELVNQATELKVPFGFDSCSAHKYLKSIEGHPNYRMIAQNVEPCESTLFSSYVSVDGEFFPCSFSENQPDWDKGIKITEETNFIRDVWLNEKVARFRNKLMQCERNCPLFEI